VTLALVAAPVPAEFVAATVHVYVVPLASPVTTKGLAPPLAVRVELPDVQLAV
jgi:hypothetical protein